MFLCHLLDNLCRRSLGFTGIGGALVGGEADDFGGGGGVSGSCCSLLFQRVALELQVVDVGRYRHQFRCCNAWSIAVVQTATRDVTLCLSRLWGVGQHTALQHHRNDV